MKTYYNGQEVESAQLVPPDGVNNYLRLLITLKGGQQLIVPHHMVKLPPLHIDGQH